MIISSHGTGIEHSGLTEADHLNKGNCRNLYVWKNCSYVRINSEFNDISNKKTPLNI